mmetsp:Transcript_21049/g.29707  ORF Transcript_21049/g.29707 Transcript_21049/m.29707 type:complete len:304 (+) Transcript_21049:151-1062(+)
MLETVSKWTTEWMQKEKTLEDVMAAFMLFLIFFATATFYMLKMVFPAKKAKKSWSDELKESSKTETNGAKSSSQEGNLKNVWDAPRNNVHNTKKDDHGEKPFGSSYYYAHNSTNAKGGYADGLRMEDYTMNGPRLLSKGGAEVTLDEKEVEEKASEPTVEDNTSKIAPKLTRAPSSVSIVPSGSLAITKFQWDDSGDFYKAIGTIRIDTLPVIGGGVPKAWEDVDIKNVETSLIDNKTGLLVLVETESNDKYHLHIKKLFGQVESVKHVIKAKRLLVKLQKQKKKKAGDIWGDKENTKAWPHP